MSCVSSVKWWSLFWSGEWEVFLLPRLSATTPLLFWPDVFCFFKFEMMGGFCGHFGLSHVTWFCVLCFRFKMVNLKLFCATFVFWRIDDPLARVTWWALCVPSHQSGDTRAANRGRQGTTFSSKKKKRQKEKKKKRPSGATWAANRGRQDTTCSCKYFWLKYFQLECEKNTLLSKTNAPIYPQFLPT